jgi:hypothetical protein
MAAMVHSPCRCSNNHLNGVEERAGVEHGEMHIGVFMAREADESYFALLLRFEQRPCSATGTNEQFRIILKDDAVNLPEVEVVGLKTTQCVISQSVLESFLSGLSLAPCCIIGTVLSIARWIFPATKGCVGCSLFYWGL